MTPITALDIEHLEWMICLALIIGPYSPNLDEPIRKAASIILNNMGTVRIPDDGFLLLASSPYEALGMDRARAEVKSRFMSEFTASLIRDEFPALARKMHVRTAVLNWQSRALEPVSA